MTPDGRTVSEVGERGVLERISRFMAKASDRLPVPFGDDCAVYSWRGMDEFEEVLTTDLLVEGTHFLRNAQTDWNAVGRKAIAANISDAAAMGAMPQCVLVSLGVPGNLSVAAIEDLYAGMLYEAGRFGALLAGGDTVRCDVMVINIALTAVRQKGLAMPLRSNARSGQFVYVSGALGGSRAGLELLLSGNRSKAGDGALIQRHVVPEPRPRLGEALCRICESLAMVDISDSLFNETNLLCEASGCGMVLDLGSIPLFPGVLDQYAGDEERARRFALFSGEEYELLFTCALGHAELQKLLTEQGIATAVTQIGKLVSGGGVQVVGRDGALVQVGDETFRHFAAVPGGRE